MALKDRTQVTAAHVRAWAREKGLEVGARGHLPPDVIRKYNRGHRTIFIDRNPFNVKAETVEAE
mgnify:CR=1 FL=1